MTVDYRTGHVLDQIRQLPDASVDLVATSPPFLALRDYNGQPGQWGSEPDPASFLDHLLELTAELRRVLAPHGSIAIELGDTYCGAGGYGSPESTNPAYGGAKSAGHFENRTAKRFKRKDDGWPEAKSLCGTPTLFAWSLAYGRNLLRPEHTLAPWLVRNVIVWARNNPPVGALGDKVRPATSYITVACPSPRRWFDLDAVRGPGSPNSHPRTARGVAIAPNETKSGASGRGGGWSTLNEIHNTEGAPPLDHWHDEPDGDLLWLINTQGSSLAHYAMWPPRLVERLILSMCPAQVCRTCGEPRRRIVEATRVTDGHFGRPNAHGRSERNGKDFASNATTTYATLGWSDCGHSDYRPGHVLDCFAGSGTTLFAAEVHGRDATGIDLDPLNVELLPIRRAQVRRTLLREEPQIAGQMSLLGEGA